MEKIFGKYKTLVIALMFVGIGIGIGEKWQEHSAKKSAPKGLSRSLSGEAYSCKYRALIVSVYDGDTVTANFDLGLDVHIDKQKVRLYGINTPELRGEEKEQGIVSRDKLRELILNHWVIIHVPNNKRGKYGRWLGIIYKDEAGTLVNINDYLLENGYAKVYEE